MEENYTYEVGRDCRFSERKRWGMQLWKVSDVLQGGRAVEGSAHQHQVEILMVADVQGGQPRRLITTPKQTGSRANLTT